MLSRAASGDAFCLLAEKGEDGAATCAVRHFVLGHFRGSGPRLAILARSSYCAPVLSYDQEDGDLSWAVDLSLVAELFRDLSETPGDLEG